MTCGLAVPLELLLSESSLLVELEGQELGQGLEALALVSEPSSLSGGDGISQDVNLLDWYGLRVGILLVTTPCFNQITCYHVVQLN
jgi:hypothetical protein